MRFVAVALAVSVASASLLAASPQSGAAKTKAKARPPKTSTTAQCAADLGVGASSTRRFCDVMISTKPADSIAITIPAHRGAAKLLFDLHNRVAVPPAGVPAAQIFARNTAVVAVVGPKGEIS